MQILIELDAETYAHIKENTEDSRDEGAAIHAIRKGKVLPKGHGDLKDYSKLDDTMIRLNVEENAGITRYQYKIIDLVLFEMPTIIEADKEGKK